MITSRNQNYNIKIYGPPNDWVDAIPSYRCELFIKYVPPEFSGEMLLALLNRFGIVYQLRLASDCFSKRFAFVRYTIELDALAALELLNRHFMPNGGRFSVVKSLNQRSLFVSKIPKELPHLILYEEFVRIFPKMKTLVIDGKRVTGNPGYAFVEFNSHEDAMQAKKKFLRRGIKLLGSDLNIVWAPMQQKGIMKSNKTFLVRGISNDHIKYEMLKQIKSHANAEDIKKIELTGNQGTVTFYNADLASQIYSHLKTMCDADFSIEWAKINSWLKHVTDFCAELRMICIANGWRIPIILFGKNYCKSNIQYGAILLGDGNDNFTTILMEVMTNNVYDIQSVMCELVVGIINQIGGLPAQSLVYKLTNRSGYQVCKWSYLLEPYSNAEDRVRDWKSIQEMASTLQQISKYSEDKLLSIYKNSFLSTSTDVTCLPNCLAVYPKYRNKNALVFNLNDTEIVLVLRGNTCDQKLPPLKYVNKHDENTIYLTWKRPPKKYVIRYVHSGRYDFYHPSQQFNIAPIWVPGRTYRDSVKNFFHN